MGNIADNNEQMKYQQFTEGLTSEEQYKIKMDELARIKESGEDYCSCKAKCPHHGKCWECVLIHRGHRDHVPFCFFDMINERINNLQGLTEGSICEYMEKGTNI